MTQLLGRGREASDFAEVLARASQGSGALVMLVGEPGIGKTSLADAFATQGRQAGFRVAWGRAWEGGGAPSYFPWTQALEALGLEFPEGDIAAVEPGAARFQLFRRIKDLLRSANTSPVVLILDDLHVADMASLHLLHFIARELRSLQLAIVCTRRDHDPGMTADVESLLARVAREGTTYALRPLTRDDVGLLVRAECARAADEFAPAIWQASQGNPLFVTEIARLIDADPEAARSAPLPIPFGVREVIRQRLALLDEISLEVLDAAAVMGGEVDESVLRAVSGKDAAAVADAVATAARARFISRGPRVRFAHPLVREVLYQNIPQTRRVGIHAAIAEALETTDSPSSSIEIAHHAIEGRTNVAARVAQAARDAQLAYADEDAVHLVERAITVLAGDDRGAAELRVLLGQMRARMGDLAGARAACLRAASAARALGDVDLFGRAALAYGAELTSGETDPATRTLLEEALTRVPLENPALYARLRARLAACLQPAPDPIAIAKMALDAVSVARQSGDDASLLEVLHNAGASLYEAVYVPQALEMAEDAVRLATKFGDRAKLFRARLRLVFSLMEAGDVTAADANIDTFEAEARATGQPRHQWPVLLLRSMRALQEGRFSDSAALVAEAEESAARSRDPTASYALFAHRFARMRQLELPSITALEPDLLKMVARWNDAESFGHLMTATVRAIAGDTEAARNHLARVRLESTVGRIRIALGNLTSVAISVGESSSAVELYNRLVPDEDRWHMYMLGGFSAEGTYSRYLGSLGAMLGRYSAAERHFERALTLADLASAKPERGRILAAHAAMLIARAAPGDAARAHALYEEAHAIGTDLGLARLLASIPESLASPPTPASPMGARSSIEVPAVQPRKQSPGAAALRLTHEGDTWLLAVGTTQIRIRDSLGARYLSRIAAEPECELHALDLAGAHGDGTLGDAGEALDAEARAAYKRRLTELDEELREAESFQDGARISRARAEIEFLSTELVRAVGVGGRIRRQGSAAERARIAVTRRIRELIRRVAEQSPELGRYLDATVKTGTYCSYRPL
ncbi:MAG TPA: AAA family ATPase [Polyangiaceae bacterium]|nr:AAA family ATPase [Polyangiaceae bacterium]